MGDGLWYFVNCGSTARAVGMVSTQNVSDDKGVCSRDLLRAMMSRRLMKLPRNG